MFQPPFMPSSYGPYGYIPQQYQQFQQPVQQPVQQSSQAGINVIQVATMQQVEQAQIAPGSKTLVLVQSDPVIAMRTADNMGITTTDYYQISKFDPRAAQAQPTQAYVTRAEFNAFVEQINKISGGVAREPDATGDAAQSDKRKQPAS